MAAPAPTLGDRAKILIIGSQGGVPPAGAASGAPVVATLKYPSACVGAGGPIPLPGDGGGFQIDAVLCAVIARPASRICPEEAREHIGGYALLGDVTDRAALDREAATGNALMAKNHPGLSPLGPICAPAPGIAGTDAEISLHVNGRLRQIFRLGELVWSIEAAVACWSSATLSPGDLIGLGPAALPREERSSREPVALARGDVVEIRCPPLAPVRAVVGGELLEARAS